MRVGGPRGTDDRLREHGARGWGRSSGEGAEPLAGPSVTPAPMKGWSSVRVGFLNDRS